MSGAGGVLGGMIDETTTLTWPGELAEQLSWHWQAAARPRLDGLSDAEYLWEPVPGSWNVRPPAPGGSVWGIDFAYSEPDPAPVTTIAWRLGHVIVGVFGLRAQSHFGAQFDWGPPDYNSWPYAGSAAEALTQLDATYAAWIDGVRGLSEADLRRKVGPAEGGFADSSMATLVLHVNREAIHHLAEVALLRDLYLRQG